jgi:ubiquinone/menaquinone biosynthesis C-methylase UbiE
MAKRANYGIDAPRVVLRFLIMGALGVALGLVLMYPLRNVVLPGLASGLGNALVWMGGTFLVVAGVMVAGSKFMKPRIAGKLIDTLALKGDEKVLDVGCGHGLMLITAARRLTTGQATGVDIWQKEDQAGNSREATLANVRLEGVADRVALKDGDARQLPFDDASFDAVTSSWALHNIYDKEGRAQAIREIARVLKPGGRVALVDIQHTEEYAQEFRQSGMENVKRRGPNFVFVIPSYSLTATKGA